MTTPNKAPNLADLLIDLRERLERIELKLSASAPTPPKRPTAKSTDSLDQLRSDITARITSYWNTFRRPIHSFKLSGAFARRARSLGSAFPAVIADDSRITSVLTESGGTLFLPSDAYAALSPIERMEIQSLTEADIASERRQNLDAAQRLLSGEENQSDSVDKPADAD